MEKRAKNMIREISMSKKQNYLLQNTTRLMSKQSKSSWDQKSLKGMMSFARQLQQAEQSKIDMIIPEKPKTQRFLQT